MLENAQYRHIDERGTLLTIGTQRGSCLLSIFGKDPRGESLRRIELFFDPKGRSCDTACALSHIMKVLPFAALGRPDPDCKAYPVEVPEPCARRVADGNPPVYVPLLKPSDPWNSLAVAVHNDGGYSLTAREVCGGYPYVIPVLFSAGDLKNIPGLAESLNNLVAAMREDNRINPIT